MSRGGERRGGAAAAGVRTLLALLALAPAAARAAGEPAAPEPDLCAPLVVSQPSGLDLQGLALGLCRALGGDAEPGAVSESLRVRVGGWVDGSYQQTDLHASDDSVDLNHANLHLDLRWADRWQLFGEGEFEHEPDLTGFRDKRGWELEQLWGEYAYNDALRVRAGRFSTPFGYWTPVHWSIVVDTIEPPLHETNRAVPEQQVGAGLFGSWFAGGPPALDTELQYALYAGYSAAGFDAGNPDGLTAGGDLRVRLQDRHFVGVSLYTQKNGQEADRRENDLMVYGQVALPFHLVARAEYLFQHRDSSTRAVFVRDADFVYAKLRWDFRPDAYLNYRFEYGEDDRYGFTADHLVNRVTIGYRPVPRVVLKAEYARHELSGPFLGDYHFWGLSAGLLF